MGTNPLEGVKSLMLTTTWLILSLLFSLVIPDLSYILKPIGMLSCSSVFLFPG